MLVTEEISHLNFWTPYTGGKVRKLMDIVYTAFFLLSHLVLFLLAAEVSTEECCGDRKSVV